MAKDDECYTDRERAWRWIFYTALPSIFTYVLACIYDLILGYTISQSLSNHFLEFILMVFAISISIYGSAVNIELKINKKTKEKFAGISVICCFACLVFYGFLYYQSYQSKMESNDSQAVIINPMSVIVIRIIFVLIATAVIYAGFYFEGYTNETLLNVAPDNEKNIKGAKHE